MGVVADAALAHGGAVHGVITESLHARGHSHTGLTHHEIAPTLRARKERMAELADAFIALPGGIGTIEEFMEVWARNQLGEADKPRVSSTPRVFTRRFWPSSTIWSRRSSCPRRTAIRSRWTPRLPPWSTSSSPLSASTRRSGFEQSLQASRRMLQAGEACGPLCETISMRLRLSARVVCRRGLR